MIRNTSRMSPAVLASKGNCNNVNMIQKKIVVRLPKLFLEESVVLVLFAKKVFLLSILRADSLWDIFIEDGGRRKQ